MQILAIIIPGNDDSRYVFAAVAARFTSARATNSFSQLVEKSFPPQGSTSLALNSLSSLSLKFPITFDSFLDIRSNDLPTTDGRSNVAFLTNSHNRTKIKIHRFLSRERNSNRWVQLELRVSRCKFLSQV